ncbi:MAG: DUF3299 domain-containing protein [Planctomycetota bacterium]|nr:DUF3299 domain-containing protein [Planctomycetota bacterium]
MIKGGWTKNTLLVMVALLLPACNQGLTVPLESSSSASSSDEDGSNTGERKVNQGDDQQAESARPLFPIAQKSKSSKTQAISFDDIKFEMKIDDPFDRSMLTKKITEYDGQKIKIRGYILPSFKQDGLTQFVLVRDNLECCFGPGAALYDCVMVEMQAGKSASYSVRPVTVEGGFKITEWKDYDGVIRAIYHLDGDVVY